MGKDIYINYKNDFSEDFDNDFFYYPSQAQIPAPIPPIPPVLNSFANFYALMPNDNPAPIPVGGNVDFPQDGVIGGSSITRLTSNSFSLNDVGVYQVFFQVSLTQGAQLVLTLNTVEIASTVVGRATGSSQLTELTLIEVDIPGSILSVKNSIFNLTPLTITALAGGSNPVSANLVITKLS
jgi:hypothetical protein